MGAACHATATAAAAAATAAAAAAAATAAATATAATAATFFSAPSTGLNAIQQLAAIHQPSSGGKDLYSAAASVLEKRRGSKTKTGLDVVAQRLDQILDNANDPNRPPPDLALLSQIC